MDGVAASTITAGRKRDKYGNIGFPSIRWANFRMAKQVGDIPATFTWEHLQERAKKRKRIWKQARLSRRINRQRRK